MQAAKLKQRRVTKTVIAAFSVNRILDNTYLGSDRKYQISNQQHFVENFVYIALNVCLNVGHTQA